MSEPLPPAVTVVASRPAPPDVRQAIARAATATGVDFGYLLAQARLESSLDPQARAGTSSAAGLYQFTRGTWLQTLDRHGTAHGLGWTSTAIDAGQVSDPALRQQIMAMRFDPEASALMAAELASDNADHLSGVLGRAPDAAELYIAHFLGAGGAGQFLRALAADPGQSAAAMLPKAAAANRGIFFAPGGAARSVAEVMELMRGKVERAMARDGTAPQTGPLAPTTIVSGASWSAANLPGALPTGPDRPVRPSMAETLRQTFALGGSDVSAASPQVRAAYGKLKAFGL